MYWFVFNCSNMSNATSFQHMARMMDSLILNDFPPYTYTKITTTHRPMRANNGMSNASKLMTKSTANISTAPTSINNNNVAGTLGGGNGTRQNITKAKVPTQGKTLDVLDVDVYGYKHVHRAVYPKPIHCCISRTRSLSLQFREL